MNLFLVYGKLFLLILLYSVLNVWARVLPPSHAASKSLPNPESDSSTASSPLELESIWIKCDPTPVVGGAAGLDCNLLGHDTPLHRRSVILFGRDSHLHNTNVDEPIDNDGPAASLYPCRVRNTSGARRLGCGKANRASRKILDDSTYEFLISELLNGLPITVGPKITPSQDFDTADYYVQMYPADNSYDLRLSAASNSLDSETPPEPISSRSVANSRAPLNPVERNTKRHSMLQEDGSRTRKRTDGLLALEFRGVLYCWYQENKYETEIELNCGVEVEAEALLAVSDSDDESDDEDPYESTSVSAQLDFYQDQLVKYLYTLVIPPLISLYNSETGSEEAWLKVPRHAAKLLVFRLSELIGSTNFDIASFEWSPVIKGVMYNLHEATKQKYGTENTDSVVLFELLLTHYLEIYSGNIILPDDEDVDGVSSEASNGQIGFFNYDKNQNEHVRRQLVWSVNHKRDILSTDSRGGIAETQAGIIIDRWFRCFDGSGPKVLCETPDWYDHGKEKMGMVATKRYETMKRRSFDDKSPVVDEAPAQFTAGPPRLWQNCKFEKNGEKYRMVCPITPHPEYVGTIGKDSGRYKSPLVRRGVITPPVSSDLVTSTDIGTAPPPTTTLSTPPVATVTPPGISPILPLPGSRLVFGRMADTLAYIGFVTLLTLFAVIIFLLVSNLFLTLQDAFDALREWKERQRRGGRDSASEEANLAQGTNHPAPAYVSHDNHYHIGRETTRTPINSALTEIRRLSIGTTGSQPVDGGGDSIKRKKVTVRGVVDEEVGLI